MMTTVPTFVVVGHVNKGKSSVVATLLEDPSIPIDLVPGTTSEAAVYDFRLEGEVVFRLVDTPGFQDADAALDWLNRRAEQAGERVDALRDFVDTYAEDPRFHDEVALLRPLLEDGPVGLLYVIDASRPYRATHEAEMEILRWSGRPGMALMNHIGAEDFAEQWRRVLQQFFSVVRDFHAHEADAEARLNLLTTFGELREEWRTPLLAAADALRARLRQRDAEAAQRIAQFLADAWSHVERRNFSASESATAARAQAEALTADYEKHLRKLEVESRRDVERIFGFAPLERTDSPFDLTPEDLFDQKAWKLFGLSQNQLTTRAAAAGGVTGGVLDLFTGGLSLGAGVALGSFVGAAGAWFGSRSVAKHWTPQHNRLAKLFPGEHGHVHAFGPIAQDAFAYVLLDRAMIHLQAVRHRAHAKQGPLDLNAVVGRRASDLDAEARKAIDQALELCQKAGRQGVVVAEETVAELAAVLGSR
ncbi:MAG: DUF3482 domain-containing protein [Planctomycetota bacterium]